MHKLPDIVPAVIRHNFAAKITFAGYFAEKVSKESNVRPWNLPLPEKSIYSAMID